MSISFTVIHVDIHNMSAKKYMCGHHIVLIEAEWYICIGKLTIIGSDNGLRPGWRQAIVWTNAGILLIGPLGTHFSKISIGI